jgi:archaellum component FlaC
MSEDKTAETPDPRTFEERVFARFDALDARLDNVEARLEKLEVKAYDTKPIWERALAELVELNQRVANVERKIDVLGKDMIQLRADQAHAESRLDNLEAR